jgi:hypothetical protein
MALWILEQCDAIVHVRELSLALERLFDNVATQDFDGQGAYYPRHLLPQGSLKVETVNVRFLGQVRDERLNICFSFLFQTGKMGTQAMSLQMDKVYRSTQVIFESSIYSMLGIGLTVRPRHV